MKKWLLAILAVLGLTFASPATALAASAQPTSQVMTTAASPAQIQTIAYRSSSRSSYRSGFRTPSSRVRSSYGGYSSSYGRSGLGSHLFSFGSGFFLGSMFHPFGGYYGVGYHHFSLLGVIFDLIILYIVWRIIRRMFFR